MPTRLNKLRPAFKPAGYSATILLPGEDAPAFEKLHQAVIAECGHAGAFEEDAVATMGEAKPLDLSEAFRRICGCVREIASEPH
jgi:hypothetical protein